MRMRKKFRRLFSENFVFEEGDFRFGLAGGPREGQLSESSVAASCPIWHLSHDDSPGTVGEQRAARGRLRVHDPTTHLEAGHWSPGAAGCHDDEVIDSGGHTLRHASTPPDRSAQKTPKRPTARAAASLQPAGAFRQRVEGARHP